MSGCASRSSAPPAPSAPSCCGAARAPRLPGDEIVPFASERSAGTRARRRLVVQPLRDDTIQGFDVALFSRRRRDARASGRSASPTPARVVVDNSSAFRMDPEVPLVVSEVNPEALERQQGIVANPNCTTMVVMLPAKALHDAFGLRAMVATSFQAAGGAGPEGHRRARRPGRAARRDVEQLVDDGAAAAAKVEHAVHAATLAFNVVPLLGTLGDDGYTDEEIKLRNESRKILAIPDLARLADVRARAGHGRPRDRGARDVRARGRPRARRSRRWRRSRTSSSTSSRRRWSGPGRDEVAVGRVRRDLADPHALNFFVVGDNLLKGAALNTVQLAELLHERGLVGDRAGV